MKNFFPLRRILFMIAAPIIFFTQALVMPGPFHGLKLVLATLATLVFYLLEITANSPRWEITAHELIGIIAIPPVAFSVTWLLYCPVTNAQRVNVLWITLGISLFSFFIEFYVVPRIKIKPSN
jgi:hypothetical protein